jgi:hypothetical protein
MDLSDRVELGRATVQRGSEDLQRRDCGRAAPVGGKLDLVHRQVARER